jgi:hypothetical protein
VRIVYDDEALWVGIDCVQQRSPIVRRLTRRDREVDDAAGSHERIADPWSAYAALRVRRGLGERGYVGGFATAVGRFETRDYPMVGAAQLCPDGNLVVAGERCTHDALIAGIDARWRSLSGAYLVEGDVAASTVRGGPPRMQPDGVAAGSTSMTPATSSAPTSSTPT